jgi:TRAP-type uncharacterized transport system fused permease subunit
VGSSIAVYLAAVKRNLKPVPADEMPGFLPTPEGSRYLLLSIVATMYLLAMDYSPILLITPG